MGRTRDADCSIAAPRALNVQSVPCESDGVKIMPKPCWTLYEPTGTGAERNSRPSSACTRRTASSPLVTNARPPRKVTCCGGASPRERADEPRAVVVVDRDPAAVARGHPDARSARLVADVVRQERRPDAVDHARAARMVEADDRDLGALAAEHDPEPAAEHVEGEMPRRASDRDAPHDPAGAQVDDRHLLARRVGDIGEAQVIGDGGVARRLEGPRIEWTARVGRSATLAPSWCGRRSRRCRRSTRCCVGRRASAGGGRRGRSEARPRRCSTRDRR